MSSSPILLWYRNTLRMRDREPLDLALRSKAPIFPVYCFDPRQFAQTAWGFPKTGAFRARFLLESVADLRESLQAVGTNLIVRYGKPEEEIPRLVREYKISCVYCDREITAEEVAVENALQRQLAALNVKMQTFWEASLLHPEDLPFSLTALPELFTNFRKQVEKNLTIREPYAATERMPPLPPELNPGEIPTLESFGLKSSPHDNRAVLPFVGGETAGWARLTHYFWDSDCLQTYKETRNGMLGADYSSKFSAWLANGSLSPRSIYQQVRAYEQERVKNDSTYWLIFELLWRDYFRFICAKHGSKVFHLEGLQGLTLPWKDDAQLALLWREGKTGYPLVDANMRELAATGFMSNRGRQNVASFLTKNLSIDWRMGAEWFESLLIDYDVCSNYGNWNYVAGVGNDARGFRYFNIPKQSLDYDPQARYIKHWLPELAAVPAHLAREPWKMDASEQQRYGVRLGVDYPRPVVDFQRSARENEQRYQAAIKRAWR